MRIVVVGGGVIGICSALECLKRNHDVTLIERDPVQRGSSLGNAGMIVPSHFVPLAAPGMVQLGLKWMWNPESPFYIKPRLDWDLIRWGLRFCMAATKGHVDRSAPLLRDMNLASREIYTQLAKEKDFGLVEKGLVMLCKEAKSLEEETHMAERANALGIPAEVLDANGLKRLDPAITMDILGGVYFPKDCHLQPDRFIEAQTEQFVRLGGVIRNGVEVTGWTSSSGKIDSVQTNDGSIEGDQFILCGGAWSSAMGTQLGLSIPMQAGKGYSVTLPNPVELPSICSIFTEARVAVTPMGQSLRFGGTMEIAGLNDKVSLNRVEGILKSVPRYYPKFKREDFQGLKPWYGLRPCSPDGLPYLGRTKAKSNLVIATGHAMMGLSLAPITGRLVSQVVEDKQPDIEINLLSPDRYR